MNNIKKYEDYLNEEAGSKTLTNILMSLFLTFSSLNAITSSDKSKIESSKEIIKMNEPSEISRLYDRVMTVVEDGIYDRKQILGFVYEIEDLVEKEGINDEKITKMLNTIKSGDVDKMSFGMAPMFNKFDPEYQRQAMKLMVMVMIFGLVALIIRSIKRYRDWDKNN
jgi:hypothetical protein